MKPYLVQRAKIEDRDWKTGIDSIIRLDYMGSSEFEWGALPESLGRIRKDFEKYNYLDITINDKVVSVFCKESMKGEVEAYLNGLAKQEFRLKEYSGFNNFIYPDELSGKTRFWWDIDNDLMFWEKNSEFDIKFKEKICPQK